MLEDDGPLVIGEGVLAAITGCLAKRGIEVGDADLSSSGGWDAPLTYAGQKVWLNVGCLEEPEGRWLVSLDGDDDELVRELHAALEATFTDIRWYANHDWAHGREDRWSRTP